MHRFVALTRAIFLISGLDFSRKKCRSSFFCRDILHTGITYIMYFTNFEVFSYARLRATFQCINTSTCVCMQGYKEIFQTDVIDGQMHKERTLNYNAMSYALNYTESNY